MEASFNLSGAELDNWYALPLTGNRKTGLNAWSKDEIAEYLRTGRTERVGAMDMMAGVVAKSTQYLTDQDLMELHYYFFAIFRHSSAHLWQALAHC